MTDEVTRKAIVDDYQVYAAMRRETPEPAQPAESPEARAIEAAARAMCDRVNGIGDYDENITQRRTGWVAQAQAGIDAYLAATTARPTEREPDGWLAVKVNGEGGIVMPYGPLHPHPDRPNDPRYRWVPFYLGDPT